MSSLNSPLYPHFHTMSPPSWAGCGHPLLSPPLRVKFCHWLLIIMSLQHLYVRIVLKEWASEVISWGQCKGCLTTDLIVIPIKQVQWSILTAFMYFIVQLNKIMLKAPPDLTTWNDHEDFAQGWKKKTGLFPQKQATFPAFYCVGPIFTKTGQYPLNSQISLEWASQIPPLFPHHECPLAAQVDGNEQQHQFN